MSLTAEVYWTSSPIKRQPQNALVPFSLEGLLILLSRFTHIITLIVDTTQWEQEQAADFCVCSINL